MNYPKICLGCKSKTIIHVAQRSERSRLFKKRYKAPCGCLDAFILHNIALKLACFAELTGFPVKTAENGVLHSINNILLRICLFGVNEDVLACSYHALVIGAYLRAQNRSKGGAQFKTWVSLGHTSAGCNLAHHGQCLKKH